MPKKVIIEVDGILSKPCRTCEIIKPLSDFYACGKKKDGSKSQMGKCKSCYNIMLRAKYVPSNKKVGRPIKYVIKEIPQITIINPDPIEVSN